MPAVIAPAAVWVIGPVFRDRMYRPAALTGAIICRLLVSLFSAKLLPPVLKAPRLLTALAAVLRSTAPDEDPVNVPAVMIAAAVCDMGPPPVVLKSTTAVPLTFPAQRDPAATRGELYRTAAGTDVAVQREFSRRVEAGNRRIGCRKRNVAGVKEIAGGADRCTRRHKQICHRPGWSPGRAPKARSAC